MFDLLKPLLVVLVLELAAFAVIRRLLAPLLEPQSFARRLTIEGRTLALMEAVSFVARSRTKI